MLIACPVIDLLVLRRLHLRDASYRLAFSFIFLVALFAITAKHFTHQLLPLALAPTLASSSRPDRLGERRRFHPQPELPC